jgi:hypothetical protein
MLRRTCRQRRLALRRRRDVFAAKLSSPGLKDGVQLGQQRGTALDAKKKPSCCRRGRIAQLGD